MKNTLSKIILLSTTLLFVGCADNGYPKNMTKKERAAYYKEFNESRTKEEWKKIREERIQNEQAEKQKPIDKN